MAIVKIVFIALLLAVVFVAKSSENIPTLKTTIEKALAGTQGAYAVFVKNLKTQEKYIFNKDRVFEPGSLYKLWVMQLIFEKIQKGELAENQILTQDVDFLNKYFEIASDEAELTSGVINLTIKSAIEQMIAISHNYAALLLLTQVDRSKIPIKITVSDISLFFERLYKKELISEEYSLKMLDILKRQKLNDGLPKHLPKNIQIAHKTGEIDWFKHDGGIVFTQNGDYIIVVLSESKSPFGAQQRIANISKDVYDYFAKEE